MCFEIFGCKVKITLTFALMLCFILFIDTTGAMLFGLISVAIHETGHLVFMLLAKKYPNTICFQIGGILINCRGLSSYTYDLAIAMGGCLFNLLVFLITAVIYNKTANPYLLLFSATNLGLLLFNLIPVNGLDGMDILKLILLKKYSLTKTKSLCKIISFIFLITSLLVCAYAVLNFELNPTVIVALFYLLILTLIGIKGDNLDKNI